MSKEDIETLEKLLEKYKLIDYRFDNMLEVKETQALENILEDYKQKLKENEANKKRIEELEEENIIYKKQLNSAFDKGFIHKDKIEDLLKDKFIVLYEGNHEFSDLATKIEGVKYIKAEYIEELLKDGGE